MAAVSVFVLMGAACLLYLFPWRPWLRPAAGTGPRCGAEGRQRPGRSRIFLLARTGGADASMPRIVRQLSALLASGRGGPALWETLGDILATEQSAAAPGSPAIELVRSVQRASALGLSTAEAVRTASRQDTGSEENRLQRQPARFSRAHRRAWLELAACFEVCEASGAPVAAVLARLANRLESEQDAAELRETALAGPRATVRLLTFLPFIGLGLGMAMGVDPLSVLLGSPVGWGCLGAGLCLVGVGRWWSSRLIFVAARPASRHAVGPSGLWAGVLRLRAAAGSDPGAAGLRARKRNR